MSLSLLIAIFFTGTLGADVQWFGNDTFLCHCENKCDQYGNCDNGKCAKGWFGYKCQYQDLLAVCVLPTQDDLRKLTDQDNTTCYNNGNEIILTWQKPIRFSWLRIMLKDKAIIQKVQLEFSTSDFATSTIPCLNKKTAFNRDETIDISCEVKELTRRLKVTNAGEICTMCINGGRNMALKQHTSQSSTFENHVSSLAIDGNTTGDANKGRCSHTNVGDPAPWFAVTFPRSVVFRADVYNREECCQDRLSNFNLKMFNDSMRTFDISPIGSSLPMYTINFNINTVANIANISTQYISSFYLNPLLTLCGVEIYGECAPGTWGLRCENVCSDRCLNKDCNRDTGECNERCTGNNNISALCLLACEQGKWGTGCKETCNINCFNQTCNTTTGVCDKGCKEGYHSDNCNETCNIFSYGRNCKNECSLKCTDQKCSSLNGTCLKCYPGYVGDYCDRECSKNCSSQNCEAKTGVCIEGCIEGLQSKYCNETCDEQHYGRNCLQNCPTSCLNQKCHSNTGKCLQCLRLYQGEFCEEEIDSNNDGKFQPMSFGIGFSACLGSLLVILACVFVIVFIRRRRQKRGNETNRTNQVYDQPNYLHMSKHTYETVHELSHTDKQQPYENTEETNNI